MTTRKQSRQRVVSRWFSTRWKDIKRTNIFADVRRPWRPLEFRCLNVLNVTPIFLQHIHTKDPHPPCAYYNSNMMKWRFIKESKKHWRSEAICIFTSSIWTFRQNLHTSFAIYVTLMLKFSSKSKQYKQKKKSLTTIPVVVVNFTSQKKSMIWDRVL